MDPNNAKPPRVSKRWLNVTSHAGQTRTHLEVCDGGKRALQNEIGPVNTVAIVGPARQGKSYFLNALADASIFRVSAEIESCTRGVDLCAPLIRPEEWGNPSTAPQIGLLDVEGHGSAMAYDIKLSVPLFLVSNVVVFHYECGCSPAAAVDSILRQIRLLLGAADDVVAGGSLGASFGHLRVVLRDCGQEEDACRRLIFCKEEEGTGTTDQNVAAVERNVIRRYLEKRFASIGVWCLPRALLHEMPGDYRDLGERGDFAPWGLSYVAKINDIRFAIAGLLSTPRLFSGQPLTGTMVGALLSAVAEEFLNESPALNPPSILSAMRGAQIDSVDKKILRAADDEFGSIIKSLPFEDPNSLELRFDELIQVVKSSREHALARMPSDIADSIKEEVQDRSDNAVKRFKANILLQNNDLIKQAQDTAYQARDKWAVKANSLFEALQTPEDGLLLIQQTEIIRRKVMEGYEGELSASVKVSKYAAKARQALFDELERNVVFLFTRNDKIKLQADVEKSDARSFYRSISFGLASNKTAACICLLVLFCFWLFAALLFVGKLDALSANSTECTSRVMSRPLSRRSGAVRPGERSPPDLNALTRAASFVFRGIWGGIRGALSAILFPNRRGTSPQGFPDELNRGFY